jgi:hypothetical protein
LRSQEKEQDDSIYFELTGIFTSYVHANWSNLDNRLNELNEYIKQIKNVDLGLESLKKYVYTMKYEIEYCRQKPKMKAQLFTKNRKVRKYRFGSDFCPNCNRFKNYEKECPYCNYHEISF